MIEFSEELNKYIEDHSGPEGKLLEDIRRQTYLKTPYPNMISGHQQGKFLEMISRIMSPERILEIGTFTAYSAICLAKGLTEGGRLDTLDNNDETYEMAAANIKKAGMTDIINQLNVNALDFMKESHEKYDLVFIDGEKKEYPDYYMLAVELLKESGIIIADNVLWGGKVVDEKEKKNASTAGILSFNKLVREDMRTNLVMLPLRDGLSIIRKI